MATRVPEPGEPPITTAAGAAASSRLSCVRLSLTKSWARVSQILPVKRFCQARKLFSFLRLLCSLHVPIRNIRNQLTRPQFFHWVQADVTQKGER